MPNDPANLFSVGRRHGDEDQLTSMLVWLASAVPAVRGALVELGLGVRLHPRAIEVTTQYSIPGGRLDALARGPDFRLGVESKLGSDYADGQVAKYLRWLAGGRASSVETFGPDDSHGAARAVA